MSESTTLRKPKDANMKTSEKPHLDQAKREAIISQSRTQYRGFIDSINRASDKDIERALSRA
jgi:hypothetical protein